MSLTKCLTEYRRNTGYSKKGRAMERDMRCKDCRYYKDETKTPTGIGIAYCDVRDSRRFGKFDGSIKTVVYEDGHCKYFKTGG